MDISPETSLKKIEECKKYMRENAYLPALKAAFESGQAAIIGRVYDFVQINDFKEPDLIDAWCTAIEYNTFKPDVAMALFNRLSQPKSFEKMAFLATHYAQIDLFNTWIEDKNVDVNARHERDSIPLLLYAIRKISSDNKISEIATYLLDHKDIDWFIEFEEEGRHTPYTYTKSKMRDIIRRKGKSALSPSDRDSYASYKKILGIIEQKITDRHVKPQINDFLSTFPKPDGL